MFRELFGLLSSISVDNKGSMKLNVNLNKNRIRSISSYSSNSIFYFPLVVSDQLTPEEVALCARVTEKSSASFVVSCINLMPFHRIKADDTTSIEKYLSQFHQNIGINPGTSGALGKGIDSALKKMQESANVLSNEAYDTMVKTAWLNNLYENSENIKLICSNESVNDMYNINPIDDKTKVLQEQYQAQEEELSNWGFVGYDADDIIDVDDDDDFEDMYPEIDHVLDEGSVKSAIDNIKYSLESITENKILSCKNLTRLSTLERKLNTLKNKYAKYLIRYKKKYNENKKTGSKAKLAIRFNKNVITDPKAFMLEYGSYIKIINKRLKLVEKRRSQLRTRKGLTNETTSVDENAITDLTLMDIKAVDFCIESITKDLNAADSEIFVIDEVTSYRELEDKYNKLRDMNTQQRNMSKQQISTARDKAAKIQRDFDDYKYHKSIDPDEYLNLKHSEIRKNNASNRANKMYNKSRSASSVNAGLATSNNQKDFRTFDKEIFTNMDMKKANEAVPTYIKATIGFIVDETEEVVSRDILVGVKSYIHKAPSIELINDVYNCIINKRKFLKFVKFVTGEERSLSDLLFGMKELKSDALDTTKTKSGEWRTAFRRRSRWAKMSVPYLTKEYTPNGTFVITMNEVEYIKEEYGIDIMRPDHVKMIMDSDFLLSFIVVDQSNEIIYVTYDGHDYGFQQYTYAMLEREQQASDRMMRELYRSFAR